MSSRYIGGTIYLMTHFIRLVALFYICYYVNVYQIILIIHTCMSLCNTLCMSLCIFSLNERPKYKVCNIKIFIELVVRFLSRCNPECFSQVVSFTKTFFTYLASLIDLIQLYIFIVEFINIIMSYLIMF